MKRSLFQFRKSNSVSFSLFSDYIWLEKINGVWQWKVTKQEGEFPIKKQSVIATYLPGKTFHKSPKSKGQILLFHFPEEVIKAVSIFVLVILIFFKKSCTEQIKRMLHLSKKLRE